MKQQKVFILMGIAAMTLGITSCANQIAAVQVSPQIRTVYIAPVHLPLQPSIRSHMSADLNLNYVPPSLLLSTPTLSRGNNDVAKYHDVMERNVSLEEVIRSAATSTLEGKGYIVADSPQASDAQVQISFTYGLQNIEATNDLHKIHAVMDMRMTRSSDSAELISEIASFVEDTSVRSQLLSADLRRWFSDDVFTISQHQLVAKSLTSQVLEKL